MIKRVLIVKTSSLGDVIHTLPAVTDAINAVPGIQFDWIVEEAFAEIPAWHPAVKRVIPIALRRWRKTPLSSLFGREWQRFKLQLKMASYDAVIDAQGLVKSAWLTRLVNAPAYGYDKTSIREPLASMFYHQHLRVSKEQHAVERIRQLFAKVIGYPTPTEKGEYGIDIDSIASSIEVDDQKRIVLIHGTTRANKYWPESYWIELAKKIITLGYVPALPWGNEEEHHRALRIADASGAEVLPKLKLIDVAKVIAKSNAAVAVDTGLGHLTAALDIPCVSLYGPTSPLKVGAYGKQQYHLQAKTDGVINSDELMGHISVEQVFESLKNILSRDEK